MAVAVGLIGALAAPALADDSKLPPSGTVYDKKRGEISVGTAAPTRERMVNAIKSAPPTTLTAMLEYGQRVECYECIPLLEQKLLVSDDAQVREMAAWWLRQRPFGFGPVMVHMQKVIASDADPQQRARAAQALGEFLDPHGLPALAKAAAKDSDASVRVAAVRGLGRLNAVDGNETLRVAIGDSDAGVRKAALEQVLRVNFFRDHAAIVTRLADDSAPVRRMAAQISGELKIDAAIEPLLGLLVTDDDASVRQAAAIALGRIGGSDAFAALADAKRDERDSGVLDAIDVAQRMR
jgi:HEAT repeat protein